MTRGDATTIPHEHEDAGWCPGDWHRVLRDERLGVLAAATRGAEARGAMRDAGGGIRAADSANGSTDGSADDELGAAGIGRCRIPPHDRAGRFLPDARIYLDNRAYRGRPGFHVLTPLRLEQGGTLLINRGWIARDPYHRTALPPDPLPTGLVEIQGVVRAGVDRTWAFGVAAAGANGPDPDAGARIRQNVDLRALGQELGQGLWPFVLLQTDATMILDAATSPVAAATPRDRSGLSNETPMIRDWPTPSADVVRHDGYKVQWWALSGVLLLGGLCLLRAGPRKKND